MKFQVTQSRVRIEFDISFWIFEIGFSDLILKLLMLRESRVRKISSIATIDFAFPVILRFQGEDEEDERTCVHIHAYVCIYMHVCMVHAYEHLPIWFVRPLYEYVVSYGVKRGWRRGAMTDAYICWRKRWSLKCFVCSKNCPKFSGMHKILLSSFLIK